MWLERNVCGWAWLGERGMRGWGSKPGVCCPGGGAMLSGGGVLSGGCCPGGVLSRM